MFESFGGALDADLLCFYAPVWCNVFSWSLEFPAGLGLFAQLWCFCVFCAFGRQSCVWVLSALVLCLLTCCFLCSLSWLLLLYKYSLFVL